MVLTIAPLVAICSQANIDFTMESQTSQVKLL